ncbi:MAG: 16S rRNA (adenine(1518)-N(6)/adenine(1519)-N(6))-dimethyltransferase RsmA [Firmicutes bacterium]|nr:16S rRNA (adenine(1518)-N(6)/adenine(1519)-N(6))-dimethyltransferase RsmA [Bacillota bacterium]
MINLISIKNVQKILKEHNFPIRKKYGQNFLVDENIMQRIVDTADLSPETLVLEIGPGLGSLTQRLADRAKEVVAIEIDELLLPILNSTLASYDNVQLIHADALKYDWSKIFKPEAQVKIVSNLPYYITSPLLEKMIRAPFQVDTCVLLVQKEVAQRMAAEAGTPSYGSLSVFIQSQAQVEYVATVSNNVFYPRPKIDSAIVRLGFDPQLKDKIANQEILEKVLRSVFGQRLKTLRNSLLNSPHIKIEKSKLEEIEEHLPFSLKIRGEQLSPDELVLLSNLIVQANL